MLFRVGGGKHGNFFEQLAEVHFDQVQLAGAHEVDERLYDAVESVNLAADDVHVAARIRVKERKLVLQKLQVKHDRVNRIFYFVGNTAGDASAGREAAGHLDFVADAAHGLSIAHDQKSADLSILL